MSPERLAEIMRKYRTNKHRCAYLSTQIGMLERFLQQCQADMIGDMISMSQAITGMPHGTTVGDPTGRLAMDIESGKVSQFVREIETDITTQKMEMQKLYPDIKTVEIVLDSMNDRERRLIEMKMIDDFSWPEILGEMNRVYNNSYSKRSLQRLLDRAVEKANEIVK